MPENMEEGQKKHHIGRWIAVILLLLSLAACAVQFAVGQVPFPISWIFNADTAQGWNLTLVNWEHKIPRNWDIELTELSNGQSVDSRIYPSLQQMFDDMRAQGVYPVVASGHRTAKSQQALMDDKIASFCAQGYPKSQAKAEAKKWVAKVGYSEHQTGLAVDITPTAFTLPERRYTSGLQITPGNTASFCDTRRTKQRSRKPTMSRGTTDMLERRPQKRFMSVAFAWKNTSAWMRHREETHI